MQNNGPIRDPTAEGPSTPAYRGHSGTPDFSAMAVAAATAVIAPAAILAAPVAFADDTVTTVVRRRRNG